MGLFSDAELQIASSIAYLDIPQGMSLGKYMEANAHNPRVQKIREIAARCNNGNAGAYDNWVIPCTMDDRYNSGVYGCMIVDENGNAIFSFRGTELDSLDQLIKDGLGADAGILGVSTFQQEQALKFVQEMFRRHGSSLNNFAFTGHSLGGNLAMYAALFAPDEMFDRIMQVIGFDSPGFSAAFWLAYRERVERFAEKIKHYQWTDIGRIFLSPPAGGTITIKINPEEPDLDCHSLVYHDIVKVDTDKDGSVVVDNEYNEPNQGFLSQFDPLINSGGRVIAFSSVVVQGLERIRASIAGDNAINDAFFYRESVNFRVNTSALQYVGEKLSEMDSIIVDVRELLNEVNGGGFRYLSRVGNLEKQFFISALTKAEEMEKNGLLYSKVIRTAVDQYRSADSNAEMLFSEL